MDPNVLYYWSGSGIITELHLDSDPHPCVGIKELCPESHITSVHIIFSFPSVAEPPLFWAAPAPEVRGPEADSGSDQIGSAPAPGKKGGSGTNIFSFEFWQSELLKQVFFGSHLLL